MNQPNRPLPALLILTLLFSWPAMAFDLGFGSPKPTEIAKPKLQPASYTKAAPRVDRIVVKKSERRLYLMRGGEPFRSYKIALGYQPTGHKQRQGDGKTPEGRYFIDRKHTASSYRKALHISYPSLKDRLRATRNGENPGGAIMIHGQPNGRMSKKEGDWTFGCIALTNMEIDEIYGYVNVGTPIEILP